MGNMMEIRALFYGTIIGSTLMGTAFASGFLPTWRTESVKPIVICEYKGLSGFVPIKGGGLGSPSWKKKDITPICITKYKEFSGFVPIKGGGGLGSPSWKKKDIVPWVELTYNSRGYFEVR